MSHTQFGFHDGRPSMVAHRVGEVLLSDIGECDETLNLSGLVREPLSPAFQFSRHLRTCSRVVPGVRPMKV